MTTRSPLYVNGSPTTLGIFRPVNGERQKMTIDPALLNTIKHLEVFETVRRLSQDGQTPAFLVGGAVRDLLMGTLPEKDFDFATHQDPASMARRFAQKVSGTFIVLSEQPPNYRIVYYRKRKRIEVDFSAFRGRDLHEDLALRDFTVNALAFAVDDLYTSGTPRIFDPTGGMTDIQSKRLRVTSNRAFDDDPLRMLRAVRIAKAWNLGIDSPTKKEIATKRELLRTVATERIRSEFFKAIAYPTSPETLRDLDKLGLLRIILGDSLPYRQETAPNLFPSHPALPATTQTEWALANVQLFCRDFQKELKRHFDQEIEADLYRGTLFKLGGTIQDLVRSSGQGYDAEASKVAKAGTRISKQLRFGKAASKILKTMLEGTDRVSALLLLNDTPERVCFRYFYDLGPEGIEALVHAWAIHCAYEPKIYPPNFETKLRNLAHRLLYYYYAEFCTTQPQPLLSGNDLITRFGLKEGKAIGTVLARTGEAEAQGRLSSKEEALEFVQELLDRRSE